MLEDTTAFLNLVRAERGAFFAEGRPISVARAPGRLDVMGGIADYSGSLVLELPLALATFAAVQPDPEPRLLIRSRGAGAGVGDLEFALPLEALLPGGDPLPYEAARALFAQADRWAAYVAGCWLVLAREELVQIREGARVLVRSDVPAGAGVSSSAALEVATMRALCDAIGVELNPRELAIHCQTVENLVVGAPCGVMDQVTSACGRDGELLALRCQPCDLLGGVALPPGLAVWGVDSGLRHAVSGSDYTSVRVGAFMGYRIIAEAAGLPAEPGDYAGHVRVADREWRGYLTNIAPSLFEQRFRALLPERLDGAAFLERYGGITDTVTRVDPARSYAVLAPTQHPVYESFRVRAFAALLRQHEGDEAALLGELMYQSHASYGACGLGSEGTDLLVHLVREAPHDDGLLGAKITGGGSGGTVAVLGRATAGEAVERVAAQYAAATGRPPAVFSGSSPGAAAHGVTRVEP
jgi:L-arabinokinase